MSDEVKPMAVIRTERWAIALLPRWIWRAEDESNILSKLAAAAANLHSTGYHYSPAHGYPGGRLADLVAERIGGTVELPPQPENTPEGVVY